jgi:hypothetical protein
MINFQLNKSASAFISNCFSKFDDLESLNSYLQDVSGIVSFFENESDLEEIKAQICKLQIIENQLDRTEYGDFQTNQVLANSVCKQLKSKGSNPKIIIEPTFGKGHFILAALNTFSEIEQLIGVEIYKPYCWQAKFSILDFFINNSEITKPEIYLYHESVFDSDFKRVLIQNKLKEFLIIGNPPWVTNSDLSVLESTNLPKKSNFKHHSGLDAMTGKGNFDIAEFISLSLLRIFEKTNGYFAFLIKNAVVKNLINDQKKNNYAIGEIEKQNINAAKEFSAAVEASLFVCRLNKTPQYNCQEMDFYTQKNIKTFGWVNQKFVSSLETYTKNAFVDGLCPFEWRQGVKHDCSKIMEFERENGHFLNSNNDVFELEEDLVFGLLKSSDLKLPIINKSRKFTIITQRKVGQPTDYIGHSLPKTSAYLNKNKETFAARKSSIYKSNPPFSIFGIGDYSFKPFKIAISGLYKQTAFSLIEPSNGKCLMLDDTCYLLGFDNRNDAVFTFLLLNSDAAQGFLNSIIFWDAKRAITKDVLMRIDLIKLVHQTEFTEMKKLAELNGFDSDDLFFNWEKFKTEILAKTQLSLNI